VTGEDKDMTSSDTRVLEALRAALKETERLRQQNRELLASATEPIAIVGMACRYPGGVSSPEDLWQVAVDGVDALGSFPDDRGWDTDLFDADPDRTGHTYVRTGGFLHDAAEFDAAFFGISPREAATMDPQHRLLLQTAWEALERARLVPEQLRGSRTGVFAGIMAGTYGMRQRSAAGGAGEYEGYLGISSAGSLASGRVAYTFGFEGPAVSVDTACSSSLVATHLAAAALRRGDCSLALAGGAAVMATPSLIVEFSRQRGLAPDGRCKSFDSKADGTGWSEGAGWLVLERLSDARRNGHPVLALLRGSAVNSDGASNGLTAPNGPSQQRVIRQALADAGLEPSEVDVIEAHGTGTRLGDPIEAQALLATYGQDRLAPVLLGSLKSNIGHTQAASGIAGVIKLVQAMRHGIVPKILHLDEPSDQVDWSAGALELVTVNTAWPEVDRPRRAAVSAFGVSGTNAHVILEQAPEAGQGLEQDQEPARLLWPISAADESALRANAARLRAFVDDETVSAADIGWSLASTRAALPVRAVVHGADRDELRAGLDALAAGTSSAQVVTGRATDGGVVFVFPGQGSQWAGMGRGLLSTSPVFAESMHRCAAEFAQYLDFDLLAALDDADGFDRGEVVQPLLFAMMVSIAALWRSYGVEPAAVVGHSQGEIAAACVAGALSLADAVRIVALRSQIVGRTIAGRGGMVSVQRAADETEALIERWGEQLCIAGYNGPASTSVAGDLAAIDELLADCARRDIPARRIPIAYASHSAHIESVRAELLTALDGISPTQASTAFYSSVTGDLLEQTTVDAEYWYRNARRPIDFTAAMAALRRDGHRVFIECSAHPVLTPTLHDIVGESGAVFGSLRRADGGLDRFLTSVATAYAHGIAVDWAAIDGAGRAHVDLPTYAFQPQRFWLPDPAPAIDAAALGLDTSEHPLLGAASSLPDSDGHLATGVLSFAAQPWLADHAINGTVVVPGTALVELAASAGDAVGCPVVEELTMLAPLPLPDDQVRLQVTIGGPDPTDARPVAIYSRRADADWIRHAVGTLTAQTAAAAPESPEWPPVDAAEIDLDNFYPRLAGAGIEYGPAFVGLHRAWRVGASTFAEVEVPVDPAGFLLHPAAFDAALHAALVGEGAVAVRLPFVWSGVRLCAGGATRLRVRLRHIEDDVIAVDIWDAAGAPVASVDSVAVRPIADAGLDNAVVSMLYRPDWQPIPRPAEPVELTVVDDLDHLADPVPGFVAVRLAADATVQEHAHHALGLLRRWIDESRFAGSRLVIVTRGRLAEAAVGGLVRSAQAEHPDRFVLVESDTDADLSFAAATGEAQVLVRNGIPHALRLVRTASDQGAAVPIAGEDGTVLLTGGTGGLGRSLAWHLVAEHGVRHLTVLSRRGADAPGAANLAAELGDRIRFVACDIADRAALASVVRGLDRPVHAVVHAAAVLDDGVLDALTPARLDRVLAVKADAAVHLDELTRDQPLRAFVLFSSIAGVLGGPGQGNYAAANAFLDAFAADRRAAGRPMTSIAWGMWSDSGGMANALRAADRARLARDGLLGLSDAQGLALFDAALRGIDPTVVAARFDLRALHGNARGMLRELASGRRRPTVNSSTVDIGGFAAKLAALPTGGREQAIVTLVSTEIATVLGHDARTSIDPARPFRDLGFDSLTAVELRNRLASATGLRLAPTLVFDHPNTEALIGYLRDELIGPREPNRPALVQRLGTSIDRVGLDAATDEEMFALIDSEIGTA